MSITIVVRENLHPEAEKNYIVTYHRGMMPAHHRVEVDSLDEVRAMHPDVEFRVPGEGEADGDVVLIGEM